jgi:hypothetical protein
MRDNFEQIEKLLDWSIPGTFYFVQILKRRKENPEMKTGTAVIDNFYIYNDTDLSKLKERIVERCTKHNARAYINLNRLDLEKVAMYTAKQTMDYIIAKDFKSVKNVYATVCGSHHSETDKKWIIDVDEDILPLKEEIIKIVNNLHLEIPQKDYRIIAEIQTRTGVHLISNPFNMEKFRVEASKILLVVDIQKNSPTILFIPDVR